jgi:putative holliday junction resolvase
MRVLAIDPGEKRLGIAVSDPSGTIANPLTVIRHSARAVDAATIAQLAGEQGVGLIVVGQALDEDGQPTPEGRRAGRLAEAIRQQTDLPIVLWDESDSTKAAQNARRVMGASRRQRHGHLDEIAATYILQTFLDSSGSND